MFDKEIETNKVISPRRKESLRRYRRKWYVLHRDERKDKDRKRLSEYRIAHRDELKKKRSEWYVAHRDDQKDKSLKYYHTHKDKSRDRQFQKKYGITLEQVNAMMTAQNGACAICLEPFKNTRDTHVDHNHETGQVRQLLCSECNTGIGKFKEKPVNFQRAIEYLQRWNK